MCAVDPTISLSDISLKPGEQKTVYLEMQNADYGIVSMQGEFVIPEGITVSQVRLVSDRFESRYDEDEDQTFVSHQISYKNKIFIVTANIDYGSIVPVKGTSGAVISFRIKAAETTSLGNYQLKIVNVELGDTDFNPHYTECTTNISVSQSYSVAVSSADESKGTVTGAGSYDSGTEATVTATPITGYEFVNWTKGEDEVSTDNPYAFTVTEDVSLTANFKATTYNLSYELVGGALPEGKTNPATYTIESEEITLTNPERTAYTFAGWTGTSLDQATVEVKIAKGNTGDRSYTATWSPISYTIGYNLAGGQLAEGETNPVEYTIESAAITLKNPTREGYTFAGWAGTDLDEAIVNVTIPVGKYGNRSYTATWTPITYTVSYDLAGGALAEGESNPVEYTIESEAVTLKNPAKTGYTFAGWTGTDLETATSEVSIATGKYGDRSYTATWTPITYTISYDLAGGALSEGESNPENYTIESEAITLKNPAKTGYTFAGWTGTDLETATSEVGCPI